MEMAGQYKVVFSNSAGSDETSGKITVKPVSLTFPRPFQFSRFKFFSTNYLFKASKLYLQCSVHDCLSFYVDELTPVNRISIDMCF